MLSIILAFLPAILGVIGILMALPFGISKMQLFFTVTAFCGLLSYANRHLEGYYHLVNLPILGAAIVFILFGLLNRKKRKK